MKPVIRSLVLSLALASAACVNGTVTLDQGGGPPPPDGGVVVVPDGGKPPVDGGTQTVITFAQIQPLFQRYTCNGCHNGTTRSSNYSVATYAEAIGAGSASLMNIVGGNANSPLLLKIKGPPPHQNVTWSATDLQTITDWIVLNNARQN